MPDLHNDNINDPRSNLNILFFVGMNFPRAEGSPQIY